MIRPGSARGCRASAAGTACSTWRGFAGAVDHVLDSPADPGAGELSGERVLPAHHLVERLLARA